MQGKHWSDALAGRLFSQAATPLGLAIPIYTATAIAGGMPIWNPPNSGVNVELIRAEFNWVSGTAGIGAVGLMAGPLQAIGTATGCSAFAATSPMNGNLLVGAGSKVVSSNAGTVTVTAGTAGPPSAGVAGAGWTRSLGSINLEASTGTPVATSIASYDFDGTVIVPPGVLVYLACTVASVALYASAMVWAEVPIVTPVPQ